MKRLSLLGSTGSIGRQALEVVAERRSDLSVVALAARDSVERLAEQVAAFSPELAVVGTEAAARALAARVPKSTRVLHGPDGIAEAARHPEADMVVNGLVGAAGVLPTFAAVDAGKDVALANKEALVVGGAFIVRRARETGAALLPVDSEHSAIHQCLRGEDPSEVRALWLTASGGPFRTWTKDALAQASPEQALRHPNWSMGPKITIDSATLMNKGLEIIEARWLFDVGPERIRVVVHPESVVHSLVEMRDGSFKAQLSAPDMRQPIRYALSWPARAEAPSNLDLAALGALRFEAADPERFPCLALAQEALVRGGVAPAVLNAANEAAVGLFLQGRARFYDIPAAVRRALDREGEASAASLSDLLAADLRAREAVLQFLSAGAPS
ncbi:MAG TPA: 1-deoxy-D-xylulose-5-phosphate reductoisomerase [Candidatus Polarisedimenticolaceae bacterium]|nr:1-deoxy-D-xylulose-5-phosphate reductoisomerase [Candidatus Polarisedimenticolaceae bacterium]